MFNVEGLMYLRVEFIEKFLFIQVFTTLFRLKFLLPYYDDLNICFDETVVRYFH